MSGTNEQQLANIMAGMGVLSGDMAGVKAAMKELADAVTKLAVIDERQINDRAAIGRAFKELEEHDKRLKVLEQAAPLNQQSHDWVQRVLAQVVAIVISAALGMAIVTKLAPAPTAPPFVTKHETPTAP